MIWGMHAQRLLDWAREEKAQFLQHVIGRQVQEESPLKNQREREEVVATAQ